MTDDRDDAADARESGVRNIKLREVAPSLVSAAAALPQAERRQAANSGAATL